VTARGTGGVYVFVDDADRALFRRLLPQAAETFGVRLHAWCALGTHFHVVAECRCTELSSTMHRVIGLYAQQFNRRHGRRGHLFEERFAARVIQSEEHLHAVIRYVLENPVAAGLCRDSEEWAWSWPRPRDVFGLSVSGGGGLSLGHGGTKQALPVY
jgi:putative transposase